MHLNSSVFVAGEEQLFSLIPERPLDMFYESYRMVYVDKPVARSFSMTWRLPGSRMMRRPKARKAGEAGNYGDRGIGTAKKTKEAMDAKEARKVEWPRGRRKLGRP